MNRYLAVAKLEGSPTSNKISYSAHDPSDAVNLMLEKLKLTSTLYVEEFEIYQMLGEGKMAVIASKNKKENKLRVKAPVSTRKVSSVTLEESYTSYKFATA